MASLGGIVLTIIFIFVRTKSIIIKLGKIVFEKSGRLGIDLEHCQIMGQSLNCDLGLGGKF